MVTQFSSLNFLTYLLNCAQVIQWK